jgi:hypothetical protein
MDYMHYLPWAVGRQIVYITESSRLGSTAKAAGELGVDQRTVERSIAAVKKKAAAAGYSPDSDEAGHAPEGYHVKGKSTLYDKDGQITQQWVKTNIDQDTQLALLRETLEELAVEYRGVIPPSPAPRETNDDIMLTAVLGDPHFGLYCWMEETGADFDLNIARELMASAVARLVASAPHCQQGLLVNLGDFFHADNMENRTFRSGHSLDIDGRWQKVLRVGIAAMKMAIAEMLTKCRQVRVINAIGNHDDHSATFLALALAEAFSNEPRVDVDVAPTAFKYHQFGKVLLGVTHGHTAKPADLPGIMAHDQAKAWGETEFRRWLVGHFHTRRVWEYPGCTVEYHRTLAAKDAWTTASGYRALREMRGTVYHREYGEFESYRVGVEQLM